MLPPPPPLLLLLVVWHIHREECRAVCSLLFPLGRYCLSQLMRPRRILAGRDMRRNKLQVLLNKDSHGLNVGSKQASSTAQCISPGFALLIPPSYFTDEHAYVQLHSPPTSPQLLHLCLILPIRLRLVRGVTLLMGFIYNSKASEANRGRDVLEEIRDKYRTLKKTTTTSNEKTKTDGASLRSQRQILCRRFSIRC